MDIELNLDVDFDSFDGFEAGGKDNEEYMESEVEAKKARRRTTECTELSKAFEYRRAYSEVSMLDAMRHVQLLEGRTYNFITAGDVDSLSYLKVVLNQHDLDYLLLTTWCMAAEDVLQIQEWYRGGENQTLRYVSGRNLPQDVPYRVAHGEEVLRGQSGGGTCGSIQESFQDLRWVQRGGKILLRYTNQRKHQHKSTNGAGKHHGVKRDF
jgi:hypothetical protein